MVKAVIALLAVFVVVGLLACLRRGQSPPPGTSDGAIETRPRGTQRLGYPESCQHLASVGLLDKGTTPPLPDHRPRYDDEEPLGVGFFRTEVADTQLDNLTIPRTFFGRSEVRDTTFRNSDLSESTLCWNDFVRVDFTNADLRLSDLRASQYIKVDFSGANLSGSDMRSAYFDDCVFSGANLSAAKLTKKGASALRLTAAQLKAIDWQTTEGEEPDGG